MPTTTTTKPKKPKTTTTKPNGKLITGTRMYPSRNGGGFISVTSILSNTESLSAQLRLEKWGRDWEKNPDNTGKVHPTKRGSMIDEILTAYFSRDPDNRVLPTSIGLPEDVAPFMEAILKPLKVTGHSPLLQIGKVVWSQGLMDWLGIDRAQRQFYKPDIKIAKEQEFISSSKYGYAGCPDFIGDYTNAKGETKLSLISLKTSDKKYSKVSPDYNAFNAAKNQATLEQAQFMQSDEWNTLTEEEQKQGLADRSFKPPEGWSENYGANMKFRRAGMQEAAYDIALQESLGIYVQQWVIMVVTVKGVQMITVDGMEKDWHTKNWLAKVKKFYELFPGLKVGE
jgi:hypothetical protein